MESSAHNPLANAAKMTNFGGNKVNYHRKNSKQTIDRNLTENSVLHEILLDNQFSKILFVNLLSTARTSL
jgi:hypothetical protein